MSWNLSFISEQEFTEHVRATIQKYGDKLESFDLRRFNRNIVDPVKLIFDKTVYRATWEETISNEIFRQRDKSNNNDIGYFHQRIFQYVSNCHVPPNGEEGGWDVIYTNPDGIVLPDGSVVHTVYVEMKKVLNKKEIQEKHFDWKLNKCLLNQTGKKIFVKAIEDKLIETIKHRILNRNVSYRHLIKLECYKLAKHLLEIEEYKPFKMYW